MIVPTIVDWFSTIQVFSVFVTGGDCSWIFLGIKTEVSLVWCFSSILFFVGAVLSVAVLVLTANVSYFCWDSTNIRSVFCSSLVVVATRFTSALITFALVS